MLLCATGFRIGTQSIILCEMRLKKGHAGLKHYGYVPFSGCIILLFIHY